jgi:V8-like Glu-specific endopeptidase
MYEIQNRIVAPYSSICYITCEWADGSTTRASGVVVGLNDVLTAHHVVYDAYRGGYATHITVIPAADTSPFLSQPYGSFSDVGVVYACTANWDTDGDELMYAAESQYDLALLGMRSGIGAVTGVVPVSNASTDFFGLMDGYPAAGTGLMEQQVFADALNFVSVFDIGGALGPGASGGPLLRTDASGTKVVGVLSAGTSFDSTYAGLFGAGNWEWLQNALQADNIVMPGGQPPASVLISSSAAGVITYLGTRFNDVLSGTAANESFRGDAGSDTVAYGGTRGTHMMGHAAAAVTVSDTQAGRDGSDSLLGIERVVFSDLSVNLTIGAESRGIAPVQLKQLEELYVGFFNRVPEADGLAFWIGQAHAGRPIASIADAFYFAALGYSALTGYTSGMSNTDFVEVIYRNVLGRTAGADPEGLAFWTGALDSGAQTHGSLVTAILGSAHTYKGDPTWGWVADLLDNKAAVAQRYAVDLGLNDSTPEASIAHGMQIAAAVTPTSTAAALALIGVADGFSTLG